MKTQKDYIAEVEKDINKYKEKMSKINDALKNYDKSNNPDLVKHMDIFEDKFNQASSMLEKVKSSSQDEYEAIKEQASEMFEGVKKAFHEFSSYLTMDQLYHVKDEIVDFSNEKLEEAQKLVKEHPIAAAASALTLGFVIGTLFTRSTR